MATYKTPDVYVEEISVFPPSVAEVETAIPAFIGYTEKAIKITDGDLDMTPTRIKSMLEFEQYFGYAPPPDVTGVYLDDSGNFSSATVSNKYYLYDSMRLFYDNGGGDCYICSVGGYSDTISDTDLIDGLEELYNYDEPTILLFPDGAALTATKLGNVQKQALIQCNKLMDRVAVFDTVKEDKNGTDFRDNVGMNHLKYGMAYAPWQKVSLAKNISYNDFKTKIFRQGGSATVLSLKSFTTNGEIQTLIDNYDKLVVDQGTIEADKGDLFDDDNSFRQQFNVVVNGYEISRTEANLEKVTDLYYDIAKKVDEWANGLTNATLKSAVVGFITSDLKASYTTLMSYHQSLSDEIVTAFPADFNGFDETDITNTAWGAAALNIFKTGVVAADAVLSAALSPLTEEIDQMNMALAKFKEVFEEINGTFLDILNTVSSIEKTYEDNLIDSFPLYKTILQGLNDSSTAVPPSGAMVGVFAATDRDRGVWKAPANVSLNSVLGPYHIYAATELDALNIDVNAGKSINAIRTFAGKGTLVWGARTLAGNDNEWRYVPVRRFYVNVEESIKKSTYWAVFEPNNANTWIRVKGMIESYLTNKWKEGALVGAKPDEAFFVRVGLGQTMTADDVLNGYMKVEIGMAVVRPAEFIVLKFSHKLQQS